MTTHTPGNWAVSNYENGHASPSEDFDPLEHPDDPRTCQTCHGCGLVETIGLISGTVFEHTCRACDGEGIAK